MIPAATLAAMQAAASKTLDKTADIQRNQSTTFDVGQKTEAFTSILPGGTPVPARLNTPTQAMMQTYADLIGNQQAWIVSFAASQSVQPRDRVIIASMTLTVQSVLNPESYIVLARVLATKVG